MESQTFPVRAFPRGKSAIAHVYIPWSLVRYGVPNVGAKALCGHVQTKGDLKVIGDDHPDACIVCTYLVERLLEGWNS